MIGRQSFKITVMIEPRPEGGLRVWSDDVPELVLSHPDSQAVLADLPVALSVILSNRLGSPVELSELVPLNPERLAGQRTAASREFAARAA